jgi:hypothetical protein
VPPRERPHWTAEYRQRVDELVDEYRVALHDALNDLTEQEARRRLVPSKTTLLGLVKHATFVEGVWFDQAVTGRSYAEVGIARTVDGSFTLRKSDTIAMVQAAYRHRWETSRTNLAGLQSDDMVHGRGERHPDPCPPSAGRGRTYRPPRTPPQASGRAVQIGASRVRRDASAYVLDVAKAFHPELADPRRAARPNRIDHLERTTS